MAKASGDFGGAQLVEVERALGEGPTQLPRFGQTSYHTVTWLLNSSELGSSLFAI